MSSKAQGVFGFIAGAVVGAAAGLVAGLLVAPRPGSETRGMVAQGASEAWGNVVDTYEKSAQDAMESAGASAAGIGAQTDELREKVDQARARMDQIRENLVTGIGNVAGAANVVDVSADVAAPEAAATGTGQTAGATA